MNDLEICKRIAEIEGFEFDVKSLATITPLGVWPKGDFKKVGMSIASGSYNPITDDALCFKLMVKYEICLRRELDNSWICTHNKLLKSWLSKNISPNKAICLAIIEANNETTN